MYRRHLFSSDAFRSSAGCSCEMRRPRATDVVRVASWPALLLLQHPPGGNTRLRKTSPRGNVSSRWTSLRQEVLMRKLPLCLLTIGVVAWPAGAVADPVRIVHAP